MISLTLQTHESKILEHTLDQFYTTQLKNLANILDINCNASRRDRLKAAFHEAYNGNSEIYSALQLCCKEMDNFKIHQEHKLQKLDMHELKNLGRKIGLSEKDLDYEPYWIEKKIKKLTQENSLEF